MANLARSGTLEAKPAAGAMPRVWKGGITSREPSRLRALCPIASRSPRSLSGTSVKVSFMPSGSRMLART